jgi:hypothetical protein
MAYNSSQQELEELRAAALEACQEVEEGEARAGSSMVSHLRALGRHVAWCMRRALHLGVKKALGVVACHTRFYKENRMHLICAPGSNYTHMIDKRV